MTVSNVAPERHKSVTSCRSRWIRSRDAADSPSKLTRNLSDEFRGVGEDGGLNGAARLDRWNDLLKRVRKHFEDDEIEASQYELLTNLIQDELPEPVSAEDC